MIDEPRSRSGLAGAMLLLAALTLVACAQAGASATQRTSDYVAMRDGVRLAVDVHLPPGWRGERLPTILRQTRYFRSVAWRWPWRRWLDRPDPLTARFVAAGYAWVDVDVRGSGASFGQRPSPWSPDEVRDGGQVVDWIVAQPWSDGRVGATGVSYDGTAAELLLLNHHSAVAAVAPRFSLFDVYADVAFPGGLHLADFTERWSRFNRALDRNRLRDVFPWWTALFASGVRPVDADAGGRLLRRAVSEHRGNYDPHARAGELVFRDDATPAGTSPDSFSPHAFAADIEASGAAIYGYSGWLDGSYANAAIKRFRQVRTPGSRLRIGPWNHGGTQQISPYAESREVRFDHAAELLRFFDHHLKGRATGIERDAPVSYYTLGEERWQQASTWPPPSRSTAWYLAAGGRLAPEPPAVEAAADRYRVDPSVGSGEGARWDSLLGDVGPIGYPDRKRVDERLLVYTSAPLPRSIEVTGHPIAHLHVSTDARDTALLVYLEEVTARGEVHYVTEGVLRAIHRDWNRAVPNARGSVPSRSFLGAFADPLVPGNPAELSFELLPISYRFSAGSAVRVAISGADADHFAPVPNGARELTLHRDRHHPSRVELPVIEPARRPPARAAGRRTSPADTR